jgi:hypothetical protein
MLPDLPRSSQNLSGRERKRLLIITTMISIRRIKMYDASVGV